MVATRLVPLESAGTARAAKRWLRSLRISATRRRMNSVAIAAPPAQFGWMVMCCVLADTEAARCPLRSRSRLG